MKDSKSRFIAVTAVAASTMLIVHIANPPTDIAGLGRLVAVVAALSAFGYLEVRRRDVPAAVLAQVDDPPMSGARINRQ